MLACVLHGPRDLRIERQAKPAPRRGQVRLRLVAGGVCGTDRRYFAAGACGPFRVEEPLTLGHEAVAEVDAGGDGALRRGQIVAVNPARFCGECRFCRDGRFNLCDDLFYFGSASRRPHMQGLFSEFFLAADRQCVPVAGDADPRHIACAEPLAVALRAVARGRAENKRVLVVGCGPLGLLVVAAARLAGAARIDAADLRASSLAAAREFGADSIFDLRRDSDRREVDSPQVVFECTGVAAGLQFCLDCCEKGGRVVQAGNLPPAAAPSNLSAVMAKELDVVGVLRFSDEFDRAVELLASKRIDVSPMLSRPYRLPDAARALADDDAIKTNLLG